MSLIFIIFSHFINRPLLSLHHSLHGVISRVHTPSFECQFGCPLLCVLPEENSWGIANSKIKFSSPLSVLFLLTLTLHNSKHLKLTRVQLCHPRCHALTSFFRTVCPNKQTKYRQETEEKFAQEHVLLLMPSPSPTEQVQVPHQDLPTTHRSVPGRHPQQRQRFNQTPRSWTQNGSHLHERRMGHCHRHRSGHARPPNLKSTQVAAAGDQGPRENPPGVGKVAPRITLG